MCRSTQINCSRSIFNRFVCFFEDISLYFRIFVKFRMEKDNRIEFSRIRKIDFTDQIQLEFIQNLTIKKLMLVVNK